MLISSELIPIAVAVVLSLLSGIGVYLQGIREGRIKGTVLDFFTESSIAVTAGLMAYYVGRHQHFDESIIYFSVLLSSNNGNEVVHIAKRINSDAIGKVLLQLFSKGGK
ncbi:holin [Pantoea sp. CCBC3-3-1]|uniref:holin n=1 Tax=Pantoea sp. CCBC3-3-1 TaxID=2490851 RepID=UPI0020C5A786|nr:holin [Pantoea sp. CCBC3-3-1]